MQRTNWSTTSGFLDEIQSDLFPISPLLLRQLLISIKASLFCECGGYLMKWNCNESVSWNTRNAWTVFDSLNSVPLKSCRSQLAIKNILCSVTDANEFFSLIQETHIKPNMGCCWMKPGPSFHVKLIMTTVCLSPHNNDNEQKEQGEWLNMKNWDRTSEFFVLHKSQRLLLDSELHHVGINWRPLGGYVSERTKFTNWIPFKCFYLWERLISE